MEIVPCSRMGHYFRTLPYTFGGDKQEVKIRNNIRIAKVWMDEYKPYFDVVTARKRSFHTRRSLKHVTNKHEFSHDTFCSNLSSSQTVGRGRFKRTHRSTQQTAMQRFSLVFEKCLSGKCYDRWI